jgi:hypothetical protein
LPSTKSSDQAIFARKAMNHKLKLQHEKKEKPQWILYKFFWPETIVLVSYTLEQKKNAMDTVKYYTSSFDQHFGSRPQQLLRWSTWIKTSACLTISARNSKLLHTNKANFLLSFKTYRMKQLQTKCCQQRITWTSMDKRWKMQCTLSNNYTSSFDQHFGSRLQQLLRWSTWIQTSACLTISARNSQLLHTNKANFLLSFKTYRMKQFQTKCCQQRITWTSMYHASTCTW